MLAFTSFIIAPHYRESSRAKKVVPAELTMRQSSARVYESMFKKYLTFLEKHRQATFITASAQDAELFLCDALAKSSKDTQMRYARMLERSYRRAMELGAVKYNPAEAVINKHNLKTPTRQVLEDVSGEQVRRILQWLGQHIELQLSFENKLQAEEGTERVEEPMNLGDGATFSGRRPWRIARDLAATSLSLGAGLRAAEIFSMSVNQVRYDADAGSHDRFKIDIPRSATVSLARAHRTSLDAAAARGIQAWWEFRTMKMPGILNDEKNLVMFPAGKSGGKMDPSTLFINQRTIAKLAKDQGVVDESSLWILSGGATALRRAYIIAGLRRGEQAELLTERLGHIEGRAMRRYVEALSAQTGTKRLRTHAKTGS